MPLLVPDPADTPKPTDNELCGLLESLRHCIRDAPAGMWVPPVTQAAQTVSRAVSAYLRAAPGINREPRRDHGR